MPKRQNYLLVNDLINSFQNIIDYSKNFNYEEFIGNRLVVDAVVRNFEIIGEAAKLLTDEFKSEHPQVEWKRLTNFRNVLIHEYFGIDYETLWDIIQNQAQQHLDFLKRFKIINDKNSPQ